jgi:2-polyprenyl-3-methyl-5-hydroxy-6-metoxy-1,4-benzoquinol methylase
VFPVKQRIASVILLVCAIASAQSPDHDRVWREFMDWAKAQTGSTSSLQDYRAKLVASGLSQTQANERIALIPKLIAEHPAYREEIMTLSFNHLYRSAEQDRFTLEPNAFLAATVKDLKPGKALDVAMGQGRNAVYLATKGWDVTGFDLAEDGMKVAAENAAKAGVRIKTVKASFQDFDYGKEQWDLIYFVYTDAPTADPKYVARLVAALKPGGLLLLDRPYRSLTNPEPGWPDTEQDKVNAHLKAWSELQIVFYEDKTGYAEWRQTSAPRLEQKLRIVRVLARKL